MLNFKSQITNHKSRFWPLKIVFCVLFVIYILYIGIFTPLYALNLDNLRVYFLRGDYKTCISEGEKILALATSSKDLEELYYILGLSYLKDGNYLRASDIFEIILKEYRNGRFKEEAKLGLGDSCFARRDYQKAESIYLEILKSQPRSKLKPAVYYRLSQLGKRTANSQKELEYLAKLKSEFPRSPEVLSNKEFLPGNGNIPVILNAPAPAVKPDLNTSAPVAKSAEPVEEIISGGYSVQVGAFSSLDNARSLTLKLRAQGYSSYIAKAVSVNKDIYKVRVGGFSSNQEAQDAEKKLKAIGYPTKIIP